jgi:hypothetical protein
MERITCLLLLALALVAKAQDGQRCWERYIEELITAEELEAGSGELMYDVLGELESSPLNINAATRNDLERLPFLTGQQIEDLCAYRYRYGPMKTPGELQMIGSLDPLRRKLLECFVYMGKDAGKTEPTMPDRLKNSRHELPATLKVPCYERKGDRNGYMGYKYKHWLRYQYTCGETFKAGLTAAQDAGEPFFGGGNRLGYDYYSFYVQLRRNGFMEALTAGRYRLAFGAGLVMNNDMGYGKLAMLDRLGRNSSHVRPHSSRSAANYLQGAAATFRLLPRLSATAFASYRYLDATLNEDGTAATLLKTGYHRTPTEMEKKNNTAAAAAGAHLRYEAHGLHIGATAVYTQLDRELNPNRKQPYRRFYASGTRFTNLGANYGYTHRLLSFAGETAINGNGALATLNSIAINACRGLSLMAIHRFYSLRYTALYANSYSDGGHVQNESGLYAGADWHPTRSFRLKLYTDFVYHPWATYDAAQASQAVDNMIQAAWQPGCWALSARYRWRLRQKDSGQQDGALAWHSMHRMRWSVAYTQAQGWNAALQADAAYAAGQQHHWGLMLSSRAGCSLSRLRIDAHAAYFRTTGYESRLYTYEHGLRYEMSCPSFYGEGIYYSLMLRADVGRSLSLSAKASVTNYFDRPTIGSGLQQIDASSMTDACLQLHWRL